MTERIAVGSRVRIVWPSAHDGLTGVVTAIDGTNDRLYGGSTKNGGARCRRSCSHATRSCQRIPKGRNSPPERPPGGRGAAAGGHRGDRRRVGLGGLHGIARSASVRDVPSRPQIADAQSRLSGCYRLQNGFQPLTLATPRERPSGPLRARRGRGRWRLSWVGRRGLFFRRRQGPRANDEAEVAGATSRGAIRGQVEAGGTHLRT